LGCRCLGITSEQNTHPLITFILSRLLGLAMANIKIYGRAKVNVNIVFSVGSLALLLMVAGWVMESQDYYPELGSILFTIGFWLFVIPLIIVAVIFGILVLIFIFAES